MIPPSDLWMLGLRSARPATDETAPSGRTARSVKYVVAKRLGRWRVRWDDGDASAFDNLDDAVRFACSRAREQAEAGTLGIVVVQAEVQEMHCFTPPAGAHAATPAPKLRLVGGDRP